MLMGLCGSSLFDNCIGRKRDVGGVVLAGLWRFGFAFGDELDAVRRLGPEKETTDGHVSRIHRAFKVWRAGTS